MRDFMILKVTRDMNRKRYAKERIIPIVVAAVRAAGAPSPPGPTMSRLPCARDGPAYVVGFPVMTSYTRAFVTVLAADGRRAAERDA